MKNSDRSAGNIGWTNHPKKYSKSEYKNVYVLSSDVGTIYVAKIARYKLNKSFLSEREAAKAVDICLIKNDKEPVNILTRKA